MTTPTFPPGLEGGFSVQVTVYLSPSDVLKFFEAFKPVFDLVVKEEEFRFFEMFQDPAELGTLIWIENWSKSPEWFMGHQMTKEYYKEYSAVTEPLFIKPREFKILKRMGAPYALAKEGYFEGSK